MKNLKELPVIAMAMAKTGEKSAELTIEGEIGWYEFDGENLISNTAPAIRRQLNELMEMDVDEITVNIHSPGGFVDDALAIHDALAAHPATITTRVTGFTASAATVIAQAASPGRRLISANAMYLVHEAWGMGWGTSTEILRYVEMLDTLNDTMAALYAKRASSKEDKDKYRAIMAENEGGGKWITAEKAVELGFADESYEPMAAAASVSQAALATFRAMGVSLPEGAVIEEPAPADPEPIEPSADSGADQYVELHEKELEILTLKSL